MNKEVDKFIEILEDEIDICNPSDSEFFISIIKWAIEKYKEQQKESEGQELDFSKPKEVTGL